MVNVDSLEIAAFFASIRVGDLLDVELFLDKHIEIAPVPNEEGKSAAKVALESKQVDVYGKLVERGWWLSPGEDFTELIEKFKLEEKVKLRDIHKAFIKNPNEKHLTSLITRSSIYFGGDPFNENRRKYLGLIAGAYEELNDIGEICAIFKVVSNVERLNVVFDFDRDSVEHADATGSRSVNGRCYAETDGVIYVGAKPLLVNTTRSRALGVLAHELCHYAIYIKYDNDYKPFHENNDSRARKFSKVYDACALKLGVEPIVDGAITTHAKFKLDELIVRVPHLLAFYKSDKDKINQLKRAFPELFNFFDSITLPELEDEYKLMEAVWKLKSKEPQHLTEMKIILQPQPTEFKSTQVLEISSNVPQVTLNLIYQEMCSKEKCKTSFIFLALYHMKDKQTLELAKKASRSCLKPTIVVNCDNEAIEEVIQVANKVQEIKISERMIFVHNFEKLLIKGRSTYQTYKHSWRELERNSKENLIKRKIKFQGLEIILEEIADLDSAAFDHIPLKPLLDCNLEIGSELQFSEIDIYISRTFINHKNEEVEFEELLGFVEEEKLILLSDDAGMGKTTELKTLAMEIKKKLKSFWVSFIDLKEFCEFYEKDENFETSFDTPNDIASFFVTKILKLNDFEAEVFRELFRDGRVVLLMDGFDEISPTFNSFIITLFKAIKEKSTNILVTSTRSHFKDMLSRELDVRAFTLKPLTIENCKKVLKLHFEKSGFSGEALKQKLIQTKEFFSKLNTDFILNPLLLRLIATVFCDENFVQDTQPNAYSIYENFIKKMIKVSMDKGDEAKTEGTTYYMTSRDIMQFHQKEAFKEIFQSSDEDFSGNSPSCFLNVQSPKIDEMQRIGLLRSYGDEKYLFIHRTFAEFFVAQFLFKNVFDMKGSRDETRTSRTSTRAINRLFSPASRSDVIYPVQNFVYGSIESLMKALDIENFLPACRYFIMWYHQPFFLRLFITDIFTVPTDIARAAIENAFGMKSCEREVDDFFLRVFENDLFCPVRCFIDGAFECLVDKLKNEAVLPRFLRIFSWRLPMIFSTFINDSLFNLIDAVTRSFKNDQEKLGRLWSHKSDWSSNMLMIAARQGSLDFNEKLLDLAEKVLEKKFFYDLMAEKNINGNTAAMIALKNGKLEVSELFSQRLDRICSESPDVGAISFDLMTECRLLLKLKDSLATRNLNEFKKELQEIELHHGLEYKKRLLGLAEIEGATIYHEACLHLRTVEEFRDIWKLLRDILGQKDFTKMLLKLDKDGTTPLMRMSHHTKTVFLEFWELISEGASIKQKKKFLLEEDRIAGLNLFAFATQSTNLETFICIKDLYMDLFGPSKMKDVLMREREEMVVFEMKELLISNLITGDHFLHTSMRSFSDNSAIVEELWALIQNLYDEENQKKILLQRNARNQTFYHVGFNYKHFEKKLKIFEPYIENRLTKSEKNLLYYGDSYTSRWMRNYPYATIIKLTALSSIRSFIRESREWPEQFLFFLIYQDPQFDSLPWRQKFMRFANFGFIESSFFRNLIETKSIGLLIEYFKYFLTKNYPSRTICNIVVTDLWGSFGNEWQPISWSFWFSKLLIEAIGAEGFSVTRSSFDNILFQNYMQSKVRTFIMLLHSK